MLGNQTRGSRMVGADGATELLPIFQAKTGVRIDDR